MSEKMPVFEHSNTEKELLPIREHYDEIVDLLKIAEPISLKDIEDFDPNVPSHSNKVIIAEIPISKESGLATSSNLLRMFAIIRDGEIIMRTVFKPLAGEDPLKKRTEFKDDLDNAGYIREIAMSIIDKEAQLFVGLPVIEKTIDGSVGSFRPYISPEYADIPSQLPQQTDGHNQDKTPYIGGKHWKKMACLDRLGQNCDRKPDNYLVVKENPEEVISIDMGYCLFPLREGDSNDAYNYYKDSPKAGELDEELRAGLEHLLSKERELTAPFDALDEIEGLPEKKHAMLKSPQIRIARLFLAYEVFDTARLMLEKNTIVV
jgi:hypothetical protein